MWHVGDRGPSPGMEPGAPLHLGARSPSHWTTREVPVLRILVNRFIPHSVSYLHLNLDALTCICILLNTAMLTCTHSPTHIHECTFGHKCSCLCSQSHTHRYTHSQALRRTHNHRYLSTHIQKHSHTTENTGTHSPTLGLPSSWQRLAQVHQH